MGLGDRVSAAFHQARMLTFVLRAKADDMRDLVIGGRAIDKYAEPIFILGCGHSGTTLLLAVLNAHPDCLAVPRETGIFYRRCSEVASWWRELGHQGKRVVEKTPRHARHIRRIFRLFPRARVLAVVRDGRDVALSLRKRTGSLINGAIRWRTDNYFMRAWDGHGRVHFIRYEDLVADFEATIRSVLDSIDLSWSPSVLEYHQHPFDYEDIMGKSVDARERDDPLREHKLLRQKQASIPIFDGRGKWRQGLCRQEAELLNRLIGRQLHEFGYVSDSHWVEECHRSEF